MGGFIANYEGAKIQPVRHIISAPGKKIAFNSGLKHNDGLLANHISRTESLSYEESLSRIRHFVDNCDEVLKQEGKLKIDKVGKLYYDIERNLRFEQDSDVNHNLDAFGMTIVHATPVQRASPTIKAKELFKDRAPIKLQDSVDVVLKRRFSWKTVIILPAVGLFLWASVNTYMAFQDKLSLSTLNPFAIDTNVAPKAAIEQASTSQPLNLFTEIDSEVEMNNYLASGKAPVVTSLAKPLVEEVVVQPEAVEITETVAPVKQAVPTPAAIGTKGLYHAVAGCFEIESNAVNLVAYLKAQGYANAAIVGLTEGGLHIVSYHAFGSKEAALDSLAKYRAMHNKAAWVVKI